MVRIDTAWVRWIVIGVAALALIGVIFALGRCGRPDAVRQAEQTTRSGEATADAAEVALNVLEGRTATDSEIDRAVGVAMMEIDNATDPAAVRTAVLDSLCGQPEYRDDPACPVR